MCGRSERDTFRNPSVDSDHQLRLPLYREVSGRTGLLIPNSARTERLRRFLQSSLPNGIATDIADELQARRCRISDEIEGRVVLSFDVTQGCVRRLALEDRLRFYEFETRPLGLVPALMPGALAEIA
jgi:hypothetical protein